MAATNRIVDPNYQKLGRGILFLGPVGADWVVNVGNVEVGRQIQIETVDLTTPEDPYLPITKRVTAKQNESLKLLCRSFTSVVNGLAYMAPANEVWTQPALNDGTATIPAGAIDGQVYFFKDAAGNRVFDVVVDIDDQADAGITVDSEAGTYEVYGDRTVAKTFPFTAPAVTSAAKRGIYRRMQVGETRVQAVFRANNRSGKNDYHHWPIISCRATGEHKLSDLSMDAQSIEIDALVEYDRNAVGKERGTIRELAGLGLN